mmetsp:Transcript_38520/g.121391  ORF Transcript_38520/g.121391 Transcript_38520/m.121391 type:complete len:199 (-) Transcript_38520:1642-2238(-)
MGSSYNGAIRPRREEKTMSCRAMTWMHENSKLQQAPSALVVGAGLVGVELAAEIIAVYPSKRVTLVYGTQDVCKELPPPARAYIRTWLKERGVIIKSDRRVSDFRGDECVLDDGQTLQAPLIYRYSVSPTNRHLSSLIPPSSRFLAVGVSDPTLAVIPCRRSLKVKKQLLPCSTCCFLPGCPFFLLLFSQFIDPQACR